MTSPGSGFSYIRPPEVRRGRAPGTPERMTSLKTFTLTVLLASLGAFSAVGLAACNDDDITGADAQEQVSLDLRDFDISPEQVEVSAGDVEFVVDNEGDRVHELAVRTQSGVESTGEIEPGETGRMTIDLPPGTYPMYDPRDDYRARGMEATLVVTAEQATVTERTVERTVVEEDEPDVDVPEVQEPEVQEPEVQAPPPPPPPATVTQVVPAEPETSTEP